MHPPSPELVGNSLDSHQDLCHPIFPKCRKLPTMKTKGILVSSSKFYTAAMINLDPQVTQGKITERLKKISSVGQWEKFLHTAGGSIQLRIRNSSTIRVQPTSIARRAPKMTKGSKRLQVGRPPAGDVTSKKRKHCLSENINLSKLNAKLHCSGH
ncbi:hypothetical protein AVEN_7625-1 [Araneus ventricosus]|uniref:Uncharacterized protein n=1 Tax=Araneus ventricosus TaxID=182803 RepID=A0A4Y2N4H4_ARAVE|nr:hypothetical protein AVEN_7625-1 [Araneus ventricosus]